MNRTMKTAILFLPTIGLAAIVLAGCAVLVLGAAIAGAASWLDERLHGWCGRTA